jgi:hypothetical protein
MKEKGLHEGCIQKMYRLLAEKLYVMPPVLDDRNRLRPDDLEMRPDVQQAVDAAWRKIDNTNLKDWPTLKATCRIFTACSVLGSKALTTAQTSPLKWRSPACADVISYNSDFFYYLFSKERIRMKKLRRLHKAEVIILILTLACVMFTVGFFAGKSTVTGVITVERLTNGSPPATSAVSETSSRRRRQPP